MSITALYTERYPGGSQGSYFRCFATSDIVGATFYWYQDGVLSQTGTMPWFDVTAPDGEHIDISVFDSSATVPPRSYAGRAVLGWDEAPGAYSYLVQQYVGAAWVDVRSVPDRGESYFEVVTDYLADETTHQFRVGAKSEDGNVSGYREFTFYWVRRPTTAAATATFDSVTGITVALA